MEGQILKSMNSFSQKLKMNKKILFFFICFLLLLFNFCWAKAKNFEEIQNQIEALRKEILKIQKLLEEFKEKEIYLSSKELEQGDTLIIKVKTKLGMPTGNFKGSKIPFFKIEDGWMAILGIDAKEKPGKYDLILEFQDRTKFKEKIEIKKRKYKSSPFYLTKELIQKGYTQSKIVENLKYKDNPEISRALKFSEPFPYFKEKFIYPLSKIKITEEFGEIKKYGKIGFQHLGVDLEAKEGDPVFSINDGVVRFSKELPNYGKTIIIDHGLGIFSLYLHLNEFKVSEGQKVKRGEIIALSGNTGYSTSPHLHFSVKINGISVDPLRFIEIMKK
jgi:murein DD-endopeptidase MepM/ murein hydrolase activator NlpD